VALFGDALVVSNAKVIDQGLDRHLQTVFPRQDIDALAIRRRAMLTPWLLAGAFDLVGATLNVPPLELVPNHNDASLSDEEHAW
jgi:hypothetical protein